MSLLFLVVALGLAGALPLEDNKVCQPHSRPWHVLLKHEGRPSHSAALIDKFWLVTCMQCIHTPHGVTASLGEHVLTVDEGTEQHIPVADVIHHSPYRSPLHSLAMIRLAKPARFNNYVQPIPLASRCPQPGETCSVSGWGSTDPWQKTRSVGLKCLTVPVVDDRTCENSFPEFLYWSHYMVCAGRADTDNCMWDRGAVMVCNGELQGVQWLDHGCSNPADPTVYSKMCLYNSWMKEVMESYVPAVTTPMTTNEPAEEHLFADSM